MSERHGRWTVIGPAPRRGRKKQVRVRCECGLEANRYEWDLRAGRTTRCLRCAGAARHGGVATTAAERQLPEYRVWVMVIQRCTNPNRDDYYLYGGRGIRLCDRWRKSFPAFFSDVGPRPSPFHVLDRIDNGGHYEPGNVRWTTASENARNTRRNRIVTFDGESMPLIVLAERTHRDYYSLHYYLVRRGLPPTEAVARAKEAPCPVPTS